ncbi:hypothetical protein BDA99DRAFT_602599 [Phascolomyces articulosus]|uniref:Uncharacterized protein n=1 Tax=Phascolomyces articulosus TaxID=60185 RepID=A0AAD5KIR1_9FUNG|nr:hypothetical protein BDA99DRAFT_602599 [Phascolomyces articulosus]
MIHSNPQQKYQSFSDYKVIIAYDLGTTYSGVSYTFTHLTPTEVFDIQNWPHKDGNYYPRVPTQSVYPRCNQQQQTQSPKQATLSEWGHGAMKAMLKPGATKHNVLLSQFKLNLDESLKRPPLENGLPPVQAISDYLSKLHKHALQELSCSFVSNYHPDAFRYCFTVPAVWSDKAKQTMRQAAINAGLITPSDPPDRLTLISEPEAAAIYCEETMAEQVQLKHSDRFMVCDAGGGTVDLIVFQIKYVEDGKTTGGNSSRRKKRQLKEVTRSTGESCGSVFLDRRFQELLKKKLGSKVMNKITEREMYGMVKSFINSIKPEFNGVDDHFVELPRSVKLKELPVQLRDLDDGCLDGGMLKLSCKELKNQVFDPVIDNVLSLIEKQYQQIPDGRLNFLFLVGGFGSSRYLYQRVQNEFHGIKSNHIICPAERAALAVVRGAAYFGVHPRTVVSRVSRRTYGTSCSKEFKEGIDPYSRRIVRPDGRIRCKGRFDTFVKKNVEVPVDHCVTEEYYIYYNKNQYMSLDIYATENDTIPRYIDDVGVQCITDISIPIPEMKDVKKDEKIDCKISMYFGTTEIRIEAIFQTGKKFVNYGGFDAVDKYGNNTIPQYSDEALGVHHIGTILITEPKSLPRMRKNERNSLSIRMYFGRTEVQMEEVYCNFNSAFMQISEK